MIYYVCILVKHVLCYYGHAKTLGGDYNQGEITILYRRAANVTFPQKQSCTPFAFYLHEAKRGFIYQCLYH